MSYTHTIMITALLAVVALAACEPQTSTTPPVAAEHGFESVDELRSYLAAHGGSSGTARFGVLRSQAAIAESAPSPTADDAADGGAGSVSYTGTNNQETGVDEADILKTNGEFIFTTSGSSVAIIRSLPANETEQISTIELDWQPRGLFLDGDTLFVIGSEHSGTTYTIVRAYDVSEPSDPDELFENRIEGSYVTGRYTDRAYIVTQQAPDVYRPFPMPIIMEDGVRSSVPVDRIVLPRPVSDARFATVAAIDTDGELDSTTIITEGWPTVYASDRAIRLAMGRTVNEWEIRQEVTYEIVAPMLSEEETELIEKINTTDPDVLSRSEKDAKIGEVLSRHMSTLDEEERADLQDELESETKARLEAYEAFEHTDLIDVPYESLTASDPVTLTGTVNNQFSLSERDGVLRVATTTNPRWSLGENTEDMENHVYTIRDGEILDHVNGLAPGERIYSARYMDERLYLVTFRQVDPFFVIDLSDPEDIEVLGELKIPGFSRYLHAYSDDVILGFGRDATETGRQQGLKLSLFDVSDPERPQELTNWVSDERYVSSSAEWEHKAFLLDQDHDLLVIPISGSYARTDRTLGSASVSSDGGGSDDMIASDRDVASDGASEPARRPERRNGGALVFDITAESIELRGLVEHTDYAGVERSLVIEEALYTKSASLLRVHELPDLEELAEIELAGDQPYVVY